MTRSDFLLISGALDACRYATAGFTDEERVAYLQGVKLAAYSIGKDIKAKHTGFDFNRFLTDCGFPQEATCATP